MLEMQLHNLFLQQSMSSDQGSRLYIGQMSTNCMSSKPVVPILSKDLVILCFSFACCLSWLPFCHLSLAAAAAAAAAAACCCCCFLFPQHLISKASLAASLAAIVGSSFAAWYSKVRGPSGFACLSFLKLFRASLSSFLHAESSCLVAFSF